MLQFNSKNLTILNNIHPLLFFTLSLILGIIHQAINGKVTFTIILVFFILAINLLQAVLLILRLQKLTKLHSRFVDTFNSGSSSKNLIEGYHEHGKSRASDEVEKSNTGIIYLISLMTISFLIGEILFTNAINKHFYIYNGIKNNYISCKAKIYDISDQKSDRSKQIITLQIYKTYINATKKEMVDNYYIKIYLLKKIDVQIGDFIEIKDLKIPTINNKDFEKYLIKEKLVTTVFVNKLNYSILHSPKYDFFRFFCNIKNRIQKKFQQKMNKITANLFFPIFLGAKLSSKFDLDCIKQQFCAWGIVHYLARSGLHVVLIILIWSFIISLFPIGYKIKQTIILLLLCLYFLLTMSSISFIRAFLTFIFYKCCTMLSVPIHTLYIFTLTTFVILLANPMQLFFLDFQLSFGLTFALLLFNDMMLRKKNLL